MWFGHCEIGLLELDFGPTGCDRWMRPGGLLADMGRIKLTERQLDDAMEYEPEPRT